MAKTDITERVVVCDAGPIIHLDEVGCLDLLSDFSNVLIPDVVWNEIKRHRPAALTSSVAQLSRTAPNEIIPTELQDTGRLFALHVGELQALQLAMEQGVDFFLTDDTAARLAARKLSLPVHGTIGILLRAIRRKQRTKSEILSVLRMLPNNSTLHIKRTLLHETFRTLEGRDS